MSESRILVAEDEESIRFVLKRALEGRGYHVRPFAEGLTALAALRDGGFDLAIVDIRLPDMSGLDLLSHARDEGLDVPFLVMTAESTMQNAIEAMKRGAFDYLTKPFDIEEVQLLVERALGLRQLSLMVENLKEEMRPQFTPGSGLVGKAPAMQEIYKTIGRVAGSDAAVLLQGESGTGKELIARALHFHSGRGGPFVAINCSAIPRELLESELFGHERGAFTGAVERVLGKFEVADKARSSSTRSPIFRSSCRRSCSACCRSTSSCASALAKRRGPTRASCRRPIASWPTSCVRGSSARTCSSD